MSATAAPTLTPVSPTAPSVAQALLARFGRHLSAGGLAVCEALAAHAAGTVAVLGGAELAEAVGVSLPGLRYIVRRLVDLALVEVETGRGRGQKNRYHLLFLERTLSGNPSFQKERFPERELVLLPPASRPDGAGGAVNGKSTFHLSGGELRVNPAPAAASTIDLLLLSESPRPKTIRASARQVAAWRRAEPDLEDCYQELVAWGVKQPTLGQAMSVLAHHPAPLAAVDALSAYADTHLRRKSYVRSWFIRRILDLDDDPDGWQAFAAEAAPADPAADQEAERWPVLRGRLWEPLAGQVAVMNAYCERLVGADEATYQAALALAQGGGGDVRERLDALLAERGLNPV